MAQVLMGYTTSSQIRKFDSDGTIDDAAGTMDHCFFMNFSRLLTKDEIKKNSFRFGLLTSGTYATPDTMLVLGDYDAADEYRTSPAGDYGLIFTASTDATDNTKSVGLLFYQAGILVLTSSVFSGSNTGGALNDQGEAQFTSGDYTSAALTSSTIEQISDSFRHRIYDIDFNNTIELNSTIYFCRINHNEFNYSSNPTYVSESKLVVKNNVNDLPVSYLTTVGLYSADNELLAVAKLSEPIRKDPNTELTLRVRLDY